MINILYDDKDIIFCVKPVGVSSESDLPQLLKEQLKCDVYTLHRLDTPVGGVMVYAKNKNTAARISSKIAANEDFTKTYFAVCQGEIDEGGVMEDLLFKDSRKNKSFIVRRERKGVKKAVLKYKLIERVIYNGKVFSLVSVELKTGRSHQIRVQFAGRKHPLLGDGKYGSNINCPIALFSYKIETDTKEFSQNPPNEFPWSLFKIQ